MHQSTSILPPTVERWRLGLSSKGYHRHPVTERRCPTCATFHRGSPDWANCTGCGTVLCKCCVQQCESCDKRFCGCCIKSIDHFDDPGLCTLCERLYEEEKRTPVPATIAEPPLIHALTQGLEWLGNSKRAGGAR